MELALCQTDKKGRLSDLCQAQGNRRACERSDEGSQKSAALFAPGTREGGYGMALDRCHAQFT